MQERQLPPRVSPLGLDPSDALAPSAGGGLVTVSHGVHAETLPVGNMTVGAIRRRFGDRFDIDPRAQPEVDGREVDDDTVVRAGQMLLFAHHSGEKGRVRLAGGDGARSLAIART